MRKNTFLFNQVAIVGIGLIGGSIGMAVKKRQVAKTVVGFARRQQTLRHALQKKAIDRGALNLREAVAEADLIILATPVKTIIKMAPAVFSAAKHGALVIDVGSSKSHIVNAMERVMPAHVSFVGSHPLAGSEKKGVDFASADLFAKSVCVVTPTRRTKASALARVKTFWQKLGAHTMPLSPRQHDTVVAQVSHLPHVLAFSLIAAINDRYAGFASGGLRDTTRIASSDPSLWCDTFSSNKKELLKAMQVFKKSFAQFELLIRTDNQRALWKKLLHAKIKRDKITARFRRN